VRVGARFPLAETTSGHVLLAWREPPHAAPAALRSHLERVRRRGYQQQRSQSVRGVIDLSCPIRDGRGGVVAAMTIPYLRPRGEDVSQVETARGLLVDAASRLSANLGFAS
jgi:DNA-binding IclR family transcriptional regulator